MQNPLSPSPLPSRSKLLSRIRPPHGFGLRQKLFLALIGLVIILTLGLLLIVESRQRASIVHQMEKRGETSATNLAAVSTKSLLTYNFVTLEQDAAQTAQARDVLYVIILDRDGRVAAYSGHSDKQGMILPDPVSQQAAQTRATLIQRVPQTRRSAEHYDIAVPVFVPGGSEKWGTVRVGLSLHEMQMEIAQTRWRVLSLGIVGVAVSMVVAAFLARRIVAPLRILTEGTVAVARGDLTHTITVQTHDE